ncbi:MAG: DUF3341 domain-containing protein [Thermomicrobiales bacterium]
MADRAVLGVFEDVEDAASATQSMLDNGFTGEDFDILSSSPFPHGAFGEAERHHNLYVFPLIGAACGFITGVLITAGTQISWPLVTGGKPILSIPPMLVIMYEGTMLGAIIFTVLGVLFESRLPSAGPRVYDARVTEGYIGVLVSGDDNSVQSAGKLMTDAGAADVKFDEEGKTVNLLEDPEDQ